ncbi:hypothetical protein E1287_30565 [Actinomadura sp. KC06]|uniref:hypothetical protein n=1 Tax=Actinomadura sp. KC06 TaxID=2530369 RepID=UPI001053B52F|nr:hypothetical protein [Actinomadura sp. KC06]TDD29626.1 hypothetical protein E1287_30565 [Actinomadura sp. KC06]
MIDLPHSGLSVPNTDLHVVEYREEMGLATICITAVLAVGQRIVGTAEHDGGDDDRTRFRPAPDSDFSWQDLEGFAVQCRRHGEPVSVDEVLDCLVDEYELARRLALAEERGKTLARTVLRDGYPESVIDIDPPATAAHRDALAARLAETPLPEGARWEIWDGQRWTALTEPTP